MIRLVLNSQSPRRRDLISLCGFPFETLAAAVDETIINHPDPVINCVETARLKARAVVGSQLMIRPDRIILVAADTIVVVDGHMLGKPGSPSEAALMLRSLRDRDHLVYTGMALLDFQTGQEETAVHSARVTMRPYTDKEIKDYIASGDPLDKAGAYAIQHPQFRPVAALQGCYLGVMGLSVCQLIQLLHSFQLPLMADSDRLREAHGGRRCPLLAKIDSGL